MFEAEVFAWDLAALGGESADGGEDFEAFALGAGEGFFEPGGAGAVLEFGDEGEGTVEGGAAFVEGSVRVAHDFRAEGPGGGEVVGGVLGLVGFGVVAGEEVEGGDVFGRAGGGGVGEVVGGLFEESGVEEELGGAQAGFEVLGAEVAGAGSEEVEEAGGRGIVLGDEGGE